MKTKFKLSVCKTVPVLWLCAKKPQVVLWFCAKKPQVCQKSQVVLCFVPKNHRYPMWYFSVVISMVLDVGSLCGIAVVSLCGIVVVSLCGIAVVSLCGIAVVSLCGIAVVLLWYCCVVLPHKYHRNL